MRVLIVPDKFKGTLTAKEAAQAISEGWKQARPNDELELVPMSDGGDGFGEVIGSSLGAQAREVETVNAAHEPIDAAWWWSKERGVAIVETARINGLAMLPPGKFHPYELDTFGVGLAISRIIQETGQVTLIVGIGGSATNDGGFGLARGLGFRFLDGEGGEITRWTDLSRLGRVISPERKVDSSIVIATDVQNRLLGPEGATRVYGPQKGLKPDQFEFAELCLATFARQVRLDLSVDAEEEQGTGAAGGLGYGLRVFLDGVFQPGFNIFADLSNLRSRLEAADLVVTAEGAIDASTAMGKGTGAIAQLASEAGKKCIGLAGSLLAEGESNRNFVLLRGIHPHLTSVEAAISEPAFWLKELSRQVAEKVPQVITD